MVVKTSHFVDIDAYDRRNRFLEYLAAMTSCRTVMWQLIPFMTGLAILSVDTASCPFTRVELHALTDLIVWNAWEVATERIRKENRGEKLVSWQIALFMVYIFFEESRLVQFLVAMTINFVAFCLIFKTSYLYFVVRGFLLMMVLIGFVRVGYTVISFSRRDKKSKIESYSINICILYYKIFSIVHLEAVVYIIL